MSKTRVYAIFRNGYRESGIHLDREEARRELEFLSAPAVLGEKDINEEEYAAYGIDYMQQDAERIAWERQRNPTPVPQPQKAAMGSWASHEGWRESSEPELPKKGRR